MPQQYPPASYQPVYGAPPYTTQPLPQPWDWRDYFITAVISGSIAFGAVSLFRKYVLPHLRPPSATAYEEDRDALTAQFDAAEAMLKEIQAETAAVKTAVEEQKERVDKATLEVEEVVKEMKDGEERTRNEMREIREEITNVRDMLPKMIEKNKESHTQSLAELQQELKSLKALLLNRGPGTPSGISTPIIPPKPTIPAWQLAGITHANSSSSGVSAPASPQAVTPAPPPNGKGKEVESSSSPPVAMFTQWRHTIETLAHSPKSSQDAAAEGSSLDAALRQSLSSSSQLADAALTNIRKSLASQRSGSPGPRSPPNDSQRSRSTLEERLRAKFAIGEASTGTSPNPSTRSTPSSTPTPVTDHPLSPSPSSQVELASNANCPPSPRNIPLPPSPDLSPVIAAPQPVSAVASRALPPDPELETDANPVLYDPLTTEGTEGVQHTLAESVTELSAAPSGEDLPTTVDSPPSSTPVQAASSDCERAEAQNAVSEVEGPSVDPPPSDKSADPVTDAQLVEAPQTEDVVAEQPAEPLSTSLQATANVSPPETIPDVPPHETVSDVPPHETTSDGPLEETVVQEHVTSTMQDGPDIESLRERLKLVEQRFADVSTSFKRLQAEKAAADRILQEMTPVQTIQETDALKDFLQNINFKTEMAQDEIKRLNGKLTRQEERIEELRDTHRLESKSQSEQIHKLRNQVEEAEALLKATQNSAATLEAESRKRDSEITRLQGDVDRMKATVKDEEEKRVKAIGLLKTVRQKLVKAEKERDDAQKEAQTLHAKDKEEREKDKIERQKLQADLERANLDRELAVQALRIQSEKEIAALKERQEKELSALRGQFELDIATSRSIHSRELELRDTRISEVETTVQTLTTEKAELFDQLQMRQAELESSQSHLESLQSQYVEAQYQLREATDRIGLLNEELTESRRYQATKPQDRGPSAEEVTRLLSAAEAKYESRIADLRRQLTAVESERVEGEAEFSKKLQEKVKEIEQLKTVVNASAKDQQEEKNVVVSLRTEIITLKEQAQAYEQAIEELRAEVGKVTEVENAAQTQFTEANARIIALRQQLEEHKAREAQARAHNKTLREELRKVQSSAALLERQRNPGLGYWAAKSEGTEARSPTSSVSDLIKESPRPSSPSTSMSDEEVNFEYLRNVILQFLEHQEMRPHLVRILSTILHFTPQETRRLVAKV
ncbi:hypothetical protein NM688_g5452 [Phlebia brevispora]|uniref:Uncharacterized protein n=1 Tax=Phlebia brevispora TaxID=194682 RepID=A0ACC1SVA7_9APHY|nr:hypothetical protein NM688_g5452 [Phlebia brevispora]